MEKNERPSKLLFVEDDLVIAHELIVELERASYDVTWEKDGTAGLKQALNGSFEVILIDRMLPGIDGITLLSEIRSRKILTPALILSALGTPKERVEGLRSGSDDYIVKPFDTDELLARLAAVRRRVEQASALRLTAGNMTLDLRQQAAFCKGALISLTPREFRMLEYLAENKGQIVTKRMLLQDVWNYRHAPHENLVDVHISNLRKKLEGQELGVSIKTIRSRGFILQEDNVDE